MYDVVVVGGNLAGACAAINALEKGASVALIEKNIEPFNPPHCAEGIDSYSASFLNLEATSCKINYINKIFINLANKKKYTIHIGEKGLIVFDRHYLEKELIKKADKEGVEIFLGSSMKDYQSPNEIITDKDEKINGKIIIDASGINCVVGRKIGLETKIQPNDIGVCIQSRVKGNIDPQTIKTWFHTPYAPNGYGWVFPINDKLANIGLGIPGGQQENMDKLLKGYIREIYQYDYEILDTFRACVPESAPLKNVVKDNVLITGDAARLVHPILGSGIQNNIESLQIYQELLMPKIKRLTKSYNRKRKIIDKNNFVKTYNLGFSALSIANKIFPNYFQSRIKKVEEKDIEIIRKYKKTPNLF